MRRTIAAIMTVLLVSAGCSVRFNGDPGPDARRTPHATAPTDAGGVEVWDLRTRPTAQDVGMPDSKDYVAYETRKPRRVRFLLPEGRKLTIDATLVVFDRVTVPATTDRTVVTGIDFRMAPMRLETAYKVMGVSLKAFGLDTKPVEEWRTEIANRPTKGSLASLRIEGGGNTRIGYLTIGVGGVFDPLDKDLATIKYRVNLD